MSETDETVKSNTWFIAIVAIAAVVGIVLMVTNYASLFGDVAEVTGSTVRDVTNTPANPSAKYISCKDSDTARGTYKFLLTKSYVTYKEANKPALVNIWDYCKDEYSLMEQYCVGGKAATRERSCKEFYPGTTCKDGKCVK